MFRMAMFRGGGGCKNLLTYFCCQYIYRFMCEQHADFYCCGSCCAGFTALVQSERDLRFHYVLGGLFRWHAI